MLRRLHRYMHWLPEAPDDILGTHKILVPVMAVLHLFMVAPDK